MSNNSRFQNEILTFWFGSPGQAEFGKPQPAWFRKNPDFDQEICDRFSILYPQAAAGTLDPWQQTADGCLALLLLLDQFPRNMFRGTPQAFATDAQALAVAKYAVEQQFDQQLLLVQRWFVYLPYEHSEEWDDQLRSLQLWQTLQNDPDSASPIDYAQRHADVIERFGRFPHRNQILGRQSTAEELIFLNQPHSSF
ncbi:MAG: DUF924 family protein [Thermosynechococcaceae cyanobacterium]